MARARDPNRDKAFEIYKEHNGNVLIKDIAAQLGKGEGTVRGWKNKDDWEGQLNGTLQSNEKNAPNNKTKRESAKSSVKKEPRRSGNPNPKNQFTKRNNAAVTHGFYSKYLPDEAKAIFDAIDVMSTADMLWDQIKIMYTNIMRAQSIMFVESKEEMIKELKKHKENEHGEEIEYEFQFAWERQAQVLNAQARAMSELRSLINQFIKAADEADERRLKLEQIQVGIDKARAEINKLQEPEKDKAIQINLVKRGGKNDSGD